MFRFPKSLDIITLFHKANSPASVRVANLLKQASANAQAGATIDQASDHGSQTRDQFELNITEDPPTQDQVQTILEYVGATGISSIVKGARDQKDALKKYKESPESLHRPLVVDWNNGKAVSGDSESQILKMLNASKN